MTTTGGASFDDRGQATLQLALKDPGGAGADADVNAITITQYHVEYIRSDGRNVAGRRRAVRVRRRA